MTEREEQIWIEVQRAAQLELLRQALRGLSVHQGDKPEPPEITIARLTAQIEETRIALRRVCRDFGDGSFSNDLHLADVVSKYLENQLHANYEPLNGEDDAH